MKLDTFLPEYAFHEIHTTTVQASPEMTFAAIKDLRPSELSPVIFLMLSIRDLPGKLLGKPRQTIPESLAEKSFLEQLFEGGFSLLAETEQEIVCGLAGQFWKLSGGEEIVFATPQEFLDFNRTDFAKTAANLLVRADGNRTILSTETRIWAPDAQTRKKFAFYWRLISLGSGWIRIMWLNAIKRRAEKTARL
ncbi:MAG: hypothetical protein JXB07_03430 [Anaerolineae bacterium]|nr:hypothetical protein [Anaerolineae bacterium]